MANIIRAAAAAVMATNSDINHWTKKETKVFFCLQGIRKNSISIRKD
jgi:hypothetical protein